ncbi:HTH domain-containing protein [Aeromonas schubertii]|uniref:HTH domain-containing protein n=1 Tax=Aeromonas schubertii TaxID=652 RepID=UPI000AE93166|nr:HTH domain-containing protein [Aeromonas schubertii]
MATFPHPRLRQLFEALRQETLSQEELARRLQVSTRTVRSDVALLNEIIAPHGAHLAHSRGEGYQLTRFDPARFERLQRRLDEELALPRTSRERVIHLMVLLLGAERGIKLDELADTWYLSRTALQGDMGEVRERLARFGLQVESRAHQGLQLGRRRTRHSRLPGTAAGPGAQRGAADPDAAPSALSEPHAGCGTGADPAPARSLPPALL